MVLKKYRGFLAHTFKEAGSLGLKFTPIDGVIKVMAVNPGTQAVRFPQLCPGLTLWGVGGHPVHGMDYQDVLGLFRAAGRPLLVTFSNGGNGAPSPGVNIRPAESQLRAEVQAQRRTVPVAADDVSDTAGTSVDDDGAISRKGERGDTVRPPRAVVLKMQQDEEAGLQTMPESYRPMSSALVLELHRMEESELQITSSAPGVPHADSHSLAKRTSCTR
jgi:hypothetical protein